MKKNNLFFFYFLIFNSFFYVKTFIYIFTTAFNKPEFIELQYKTFKKFLEDEYEYIVFNDAKDLILEKKIKEVCERFSIRCFRVPQELHKCNWPEPMASFLNLGEHPFTASFRHGDAVKFAFDSLGFDHNDIVLLIDSDTFLIRKFNIKKFLKETELAAMVNSARNNSMKVIAPALVFFNIPKLQNVKSIIFQPGLLSYTFMDTFYFLHYYLTSHPNLKFKTLTQESIQYLSKLNNQDLLKMLYNKKEIKFIKDLNNIYENNNYLQYKKFEKSRIIEKSFLDLGSGRGNTMWHEKKIEILKNFISSIF